MRSAVMPLYKDCSYWRTTQFYGYAQKRVVLYFFDLNQGGHSYYLIGWSYKNRRSVFFSCYAKRHNPINHIGEKHNTKGTCISLSSLSRAVFWSGEGSAFDAFSSKPNGYVLIIAECWLQNAVRCYLNADLRKPNAVIGTPNAVR